MGSTNLQWYNNLERQKTLIGISNNTRGWKKAKEPLYKCSSPCYAFCLPWQQYNSFFFEILQSVTGFELNWLQVKSFEWWLWYTATACLISTSSLHYSHQVTHCILLLIPFGHNKMINIEIWAATNDYYHHQWKSQASKCSE